jgi:hypothetical protein
MGLGTRHLAAAAMSRATKSVGVVVSESAVVRLFERGSLVAELIPELWLLDRYSVHLQKLIRKKKWPSVGRGGGLRESSCRGRGKRSASPPAEGFLAKEPHAAALSPTQRSRLTKAASAACSTGLSPHLA